MIFGIRRLPFYLPFITNAGREAGELDEDEVASYLRGRAFVSKNAQGADQKDEFAHIVQDAFARAARCIPDPPKYPKRMMEMFLPVGAGPKMARDRRNHPSN